MVFNDADQTAAMLEAVKMSGAVGRPENSFVSGQRSQNLTPEGLEILVTVHLGRGKEGCHILAANEG